MVGRVLLIEDEPNISEALRFLLARDGWNVVTHANGRDANHIILAHKPDILVLDVMLPDKSGYEILQDLRADPHCQHIPVLMLTARGQKKDKELAHRLGATRFMTKPFANDDVRQALREMVQSDAN